MSTTVPTATTPWQSGDAYDAYMGRWSRLAAPEFLQWLDAPGGLRWLDVGCGTGMLSEAILARCAPSAVTGVDPSPGFLATARARLADRAAFAAGSAQALPLADGAVDVAACALVLNFVPDAVAALREMSRVTAAGGTVAAYVWDYGERMDLIRTYWRAAAEIDPDAARLDQGELFPLCKPEALRAAFESAGLRQVQVGAIDVPMRFASFDDYWRPFLGGQGPAPSHAMRLAPAARERVRERLQELLHLQPDGSIALRARAWSCRGTVAA